MKAKTQGVHHIGLTVPDINIARAFFVGDGAVLITPWRTEDPATAMPFNRNTNIGLHHLALRVDSTGDLEMLCTELALGETELRHMMCAIPGNIRLDLIAG